MLLLTFPAFLLCSVKSLAPFPAFISIPVSPSYSVGAFGLLRTEKVSARGESTGKESEMACPRLR